MIDSKPRLGLPLVHHLVQKCVLDLSPTVLGDMPTAQGELKRPAGPSVHRELPQAAAHPAGEPDRNLPQRPAEMFLVEPAMNYFEPVQQEHVAGAGTLAAPRSRGRVFLHRELEKLALGRSAQRPTDPGIEETNDGLENPVRSVRVAPMNAENAPAETKHHRTVGVGDDSLYLPQSKHQQSIFEHEVQFPPRFPAWVLTRFLPRRPAAPPPRFHNP
jgi:hypothetical protein